MKSTLVNQFFILYSQSCYVNSAAWCNFYFTRQDLISIRSKYLWIFFKCFFWSCQRQIINCTVRNIFKILQYCWKPYDIEFLTFSCPKIQCLWSGLLGIKILAIASFTISNFCHRAITNSVKKRLAIIQDLIFICFKDLWKFCNAFLELIKINN